ncbi:Phosphatidylglycerol phospholipase C [Apiospora marii]|uniref:Phosphatidylglycerol phospholipase C n=1 Tax=Apiospora marii TaxID=335849 RepID=UPI0031308126
MPRLLDLLEYLGQPGQHDIWLLLDIKTHDDQAQLLVKLAHLLASVPTTRPWRSRTMLALWDVREITMSILFTMAEWVRGCLRYLPGFPIALNAFSPPYATAMLPLVQLLIRNQPGSAFLKCAKGHDRLVISWSDNTDEWMMNSLANEVDGVITDDPKLFLEVCEQWSKSNGKVQDGVGQRLSAKQIVLWLIINLMVIVGELVTGLIKGSSRTQVNRAFGI